MKALLFISASIIVCVALLGVTKTRKKEHDKEEKRSKYQDIKLRVTHDVLQEYLSMMAEKQNLLQKSESMHRALEEELHLVQTKADQRKGELDTCKGDQKSASDELATAETEFNKLQAQTNTEKTSWKTEAEMLQQQLAARSAVCDFVKTGSQGASKLCGNKVSEEAPKQEEPKAEAPKQEEPKAEAPKQEEPKAEAPKQEEPKAEAPKQEEPEAPKQEEPKAEAPKQEEPEAPKQEEPKAEAPKKR